MNEKRVLAVDLDGTLIESDLLVASLRHLMAVELREGMRRSILWCVENGHDI